MRGGPIYIGMERRRPLGVSLLAFVQATGALATGALLAVVWTRSSALLDDTLSERAIAILFHSRKVTAVLLGSGLAISAWLAWGLWSLREWARVITLGFFAVNIAAIVLQLIVTVGMPANAVFLLLLARLAVSVVFIGYLQSRDVTRAFKRRYP